MADLIKKGVIKRVEDENTTYILYPKTTADQVEGLATVATSGDYNDLTNKPIPNTTTANKVLLSTSTSGTTKWSDFSTAGYLKTDTSGVISIDSSITANNADKVDNLHMLDQTYAYLGYLDISIGCVNAVVITGKTESEIMALTGNLYGKLYLASDTGKYWRRKNTQTTASSANWRDDTAAATASLALPNQLTTTEDYVYVRLNVNQQYYSRLPMFYVEAAYDNISGTTQITGFCRQQNQFDITSCSYNGNNLVGIYQESANTDKFIFRFTKFRSSYGATNQLTITPRIYYNECSGTPTVTFIGKDHADYATVKAYSYKAVPTYGNYRTNINGDWLPISSNTFNLGTSSLKWKNIYGVSIYGDTLYENGVSLATLSTGASNKDKYLHTNSSTGALEWASSPDTNTWRNIKIGTTEVLGTGINTGALTFVSQNTNDGDVAFTYDSGIKATAKMPTALKNPNALTIKGGSTSLAKTYDGAEARTYTFSATPNTDGSLRISDGTNNVDVQLNGEFTDNDHYPTTFAWTNGTTAGPTGSLTGNTGFSAVSFEAIPSATASQSGVVTTDAQTFAGAKTFTGAIKYNNSNYSNSLTLTSNGYKAQLKFAGDGHNATNVTLETVYLSDTTDTTVHTQQLQNKDGIIALTSDLPQVMRFI